MTEKPRYAGKYVNGRLTLTPVSSEVEKPRYRVALTPGSVEGQFSIAASVPLYRNNVNALAPTEAEIRRELGNQQRGGDVQITYFPTSTSNPEDPRTAAMGYDRGTQTVRIEWGDGGAAYNYYDVPPNIWNAIRRVKSPGKYINRVLNNYLYGPA